MFTATSIIKIAAAVIIVSKAVYEVSAASVKGAKVLNQKRQAKKRVEKIDPNAAPTI